MAFLDGNGVELNIGDTVRMNYENDSDVGKVVEMFTDTFGDAVAQVDFVSGGDLVNCENLEKLSNRKQALNDWLPQVGDKVTITETSIGYDGNEITPGSSGKVVRMLTNDSGKQNDFVEVDFGDGYGEMVPVEHLEITAKKQASDPKERLDYIRGLIQDENISWLELAELDSLKEFIDPSDVLLLEWAGVPEKTSKKASEVNCLNCNIADYSGTTNTNGRPGVCMNGMSYFPNGAAMCQDFDYIGEDLTDDKNYPCAFPSGFPNKNKPKKDDEEDKTMVARKIAKPAFDSFDPYYKKYLDQINAEAKPKGFDVREYMPNSPSIWEVWQLGGAMDIHLTDFEVGDVDGVSAFIRSQTTASKKQATDGMSPADYKVGDIIAWNAWLPPKRMIIVGKDPALNPGLAAMDADCEISGNYTLYTIPLSDIQNGLVAPTGQVFSNKKQSSKFQIGDRVKLINLGLEIDKMLEGETGIITDIEADELYPYIIKLDSGNRSGYKIDLDESEMEKLSNKKQAADWIPKEGDVVVVVNNTQLVDDYEASPLEKGTVCEIVGYSPDGFVPDSVTVKLKNGWVGYVKIKDVELYTRTVANKKQATTSIDMDGNLIRVGDKVSVFGDNAWQYDGIVIEIDTEGYLLVDNDGIQEWINSEYLSLQKSSNKKQALYDGDYDFKVGDLVWLTPEGAKLIDDQSAINDVFTITYIGNVIGTRNIIIESYNGQSFSVVAKQIILVTEAVKEIPKTSCQCEHCKQTIDENTQDWFYVESKIKKIGFVFICGLCGTEVEAMFLEDILECPGCGSDISKEMSEIKESKKIHKECSQDFMWKTGGEFNEQRDTVVCRTADHSINDRQTSERDNETLDRILAMYKEFKDKKWNLSRYDGIQLYVGDAKKLKDKISGFVNQRKIADEDTSKMVDDISSDLDRVIEDAENASDDYNEKDAGIEYVPYRQKVSGMGNVPDFVLDAVSSVEADQDSENTKLDLLARLKHEADEYKAINPDYTNEEKALFIECAVREVRKNSSMLEGKKQQKLMDRALRVINKVLK